MALGSAAGLSAGASFRRFRGSDELRCRVRPAAPAFPPAATDSLTRDSRATPEECLPAATGYCFPFEKSEELAVSPAAACWSDCPKAARTAARRPRPLLPSSGMGSAAPSESSCCGEKVSADGLGERDITGVERERSLPTELGRLSLHSGLERKTVATKEQPLPIPGDEQVKSPPCATQRAAQRVNDCLEARKTRRVSQPIAGEERCGVLWRRGSSRASSRGRGR